MTRDREADLDKLATAYIERLERSECEYGAWGTDDKRPFGFSGRYSIGCDILAFIGWEPEGEEEDCRHCTDEQQEYAHALYDDLGDHIRKRWQELMARRGE